MKKGVVGMRSFFLLICLAVGVASGCTVTTPLGGDGDHDEEKDAGEDAPNTASGENESEEDTVDLSGFKIYLLDEDESDTAPFSVDEIAGLSQNISQVALNDTPLIQETDIAVYYWETQQIYLTTEAVVRIANSGQLSNIQSPASSFDPVPFVVVASGERIYLGVFWPSVLSSLPPCPWGTVFTSGNNWVLEISATETDAAKLTDPRIYTALTAAQVPLQ